jgi:hypothetical protein
LADKTSKKHTRSTSVGDVNGEEVYGKLVQATNDIANENAVSKKRKTSTNDPDEKSRSKSQSPSPPPIQSGGNSNQSGPSVRSHEVDVMGEIISCGWRGSKDVASYERHKEKCKLRLISIRLHNDFETMKQSIKSRDQRIEALERDRKAIKDAFDCSINDKQLLSETIRKLRRELDHYKSRCGVPSDPREHKTQHITDKPILTDVPTINKTTSVPDVLPTVPTIINKQTVDQLEAVVATSLTQLASNVQVPDKDDVKTKLSENVSLHIKIEYLKLGPHATGTMAISTPRSIYDAICMLAPLAVDNGGRCDAVKQGLIKMDEKGALSMGRVSFDLFYFF